MKLLALIFACLITATLVAQQTPPSDQTAPPSQRAAPGYTAKYKGDPARSDAAFAALSYMPVVIRAE